MSLQRAVNKLDCEQAERSLAKIGTKGSVHYFIIWNFISHVKRLQEQEKIPVLLQATRISKEGE